MLSYKRVVFSALLILVIFMGGAIWYCASVSLKAEYSLHASLFVIELVNDHITSRNGEWPKSWKDLEELPARNCGMFQWPQDSGKIQAIVFVDFEVDPKVLTNEPNEQFSAIRPRGPCYPYTHYSQLEELLSTVREYHGNLSTNCRIEPLH